MKKYRLHYSQTNEGWIEVEASTAKSAINKAEEELRGFYPDINCIELPNGNQVSINEIL